MFFIAALLIDRSNKSYAGEAACARGFKTTTSVAHNLYNTDSVQTSMMVFLSRISVALILQKFVLGHKKSGGKSFASIQLGIHHVSMHGIRLFTLPRLSYIRETKQPVGSFSVIFEISALEYSAIATRRDTDICC
jgi:hypothetical protein